MIYNHLQITVKMHKAANNETRIVGFEVHPMSRDMNDDHVLKCSHQAQYDPFYLKPNEDFIFSYCVRVQVSKKQKKSNQILCYSKILILSGLIVWIIIIKREMRIFTCFSCQFLLELSSWRHAWSPRS